MTPDFLLGAVAIAVAAGLFGSLLGLGGGLFVVPLLTGLLGVSTGEAIGASVVAVVATSCVGGSTYLRYRVVNVPLGMRLELATVCGAIVGALLLTIADPRLLNAVFGLVLTYTGVVMLRGGGRADQVETPSGPPDPHDYSYYNVRRQVEIAYRVRRVPAGVAASLVGGFVSGILGVGGGLFNVPAMTVLMGVPLRVAAGTSAFMIGVTGTAGAFIQYAHGLIDARLALPVVAGVITGAAFGPRLSRHVTQVRLNQVFVVVVFVFAAEMLWRAAAGAR